MICKACGKMEYPSKEGALTAIQTLKRYQTGPRPKGAIFYPYKCPENKKIWHVADSLIRKQEKDEEEEKEGFVGRHVFETWA